MVDWVPGTANFKADEAANSNTHRFDLAKRIIFKESGEWWDILPDVLQNCREVERECERVRAEEAGLPDRTAAQKRRRLEDRLRVKDPW